MATSSIIFVVQLLFLTTGNLLLLTAAAPIDDICRKTKDPPQCAAILKNTDSRAATAPLPLLEYIAIEAGQIYGGQTKITVQNFADAAQDPNLKSIFRNCENSFRDGLDAFDRAQEYLQKRQFGELVRTAGVLGRVVGVCAPAVGRSFGLARGVDDTGLTAEAIGIIARNLR